MLSTPDDRLWYAAKAVENGWSGGVLALQIGSSPRERRGKAVTNFAKTLPPPQSDLVAREGTKDPNWGDGRQSQVCAPLLPTSPVALDVVANRR